MIGIIFALKEEASNFEKALEGKKNKTYDRFRLLEGRFLNNDIVTVKTGMGRQNAKEGARCLLKNFAIEYVISAGFAGALHPELRIGDLIIGEDISTPVLLELAEGLRVDNIRLKKGKIISERHIACSVNKKRELFLATGALAVDMETDAIRDETLKAGIPLLAVRSICDAANEPVNLLRILRLYSQTKTAELSLYNFFNEWFKKNEVRRRRNKEG